MLHTDGRRRGSCTDILCSCLQTHCPGAGICTIAAAVVCEVVRKSGLPCVLCLCGGSECTGRRDAGISDTYASVGDFTRGGAGCPWEYIPPGMLDHTEAVSSLYSVDILGDGIGTGVPIEVTVNA